MNTNAAEVLEKFFAVRKKVAIAIDVSGAMHPDAIEKFIHLCARAGAQSPDKLFFFDATVRRVVPFEDYQFGSIPGRGGTDFTCVLKCVEIMEECEGVIFLTDGYGHVFDECPVPVLWVLVDEEPYKEHLPGEIVVLEY
jgi:predicted metal-dependent peptidase